MKKKKLGLSDLKVNSFVTTVKANKLKGGHCFSANMCTDLGAGGGQCFGNDQSISPDNC